jgi:hypothetical protein
MVSGDPNSYLRRRTRTSTLENLKTELAALRDEAKVQAHLGGMEA